MEGAVPGYLHYFVMERHVAGVTDDTQRHAGRPIWYYLPIILAGAWPWILFAVRRGGRSMSDGERLLWAWFVADVAVLSLAGSKLATYVLPALPALAALAALTVVRTPDGGPVRGGLQRVGSVASGATALLPLGAVAALLLTAPGSVPALPSLLWIAGPVFVFGATLMPRQGGRAWNPAEQLLIVTAATLVVTTLAVRPAVAGRLSARTLAVQLNAAGALPSRVWVVDEGTGSLVFYLRPEWRRQLVAGRIARISRFSLADLPDPADAVVAVASDRVPGVAELIDLAGVARPPDGQFLVLPLAEIRRRVRPSPGE
jgi:4-amino-4-deoxy-L-arabinose transferase-like glycosyltransferase